MTFARHNPVLSAAVVAVAVSAAAFGALTLLNRSSAPPAAPPAVADGAAPARSTDGRIDQLQAQVRAAPKQADGWALLGDAYLQKVRETGDASFYTRAAGVLRRALALSPNDAGALAGAGTLALARHDFATGLRYGEAAHRAAPNVVLPLGVIVDAQVELGRYGEAARTLNRMVDLKPNLASYARVSYFRGLHGAVARLPLPEYVVALGETELAAGRRTAARRDLALVDAEERLLRVNGVNTDVDLALFEANHGDPARGVALARRAWGAAPSVRSADALGWSLTRAGNPAAGLRWAKRSLRLGSADPAFLYHAGMTARATGHAALAQRWLRRALARNPRFSPLYAPRARAALR